MTKLATLFAGFIAVSSLSSPAFSQDLMFDFNNFENCTRLAASPSHCIGVAAEACMTDTFGGESTIGAGACYSAELQAWDDRLNATYRTLRAALARSDAEDASSVSQADAMQQMQITWIAFRDGKCDFVRSQWGGGTGAGAANTECLMQETAEQAMYLGDVLAMY